MIIFDVIEESADYVLIEVPHRLTVDNCQELKDVYGLRICGIDSIIRGEYERWVMCEKTEMCMT